jgi:hypothetical protein
MKFRKKPVVVEAEQWFKNGDHSEDGPAAQEGKVVRYYRSPLGDGNEFCQYCKNPMHIHGWIDTWEGGHIVCPGDWIITGLAGERYPCKPDMFKQIYEPVHGSWFAGSNIAEPWRPEREKKCFYEGEEVIPYLVGPSYSWIHDVGIGLAYPGKIVQTSELHPSLPEPPVKVGEYYAVESNGREFAGKVTNVYPESCRFVIADIRTFYWNTGNKITHLVPAPQEQQP